VIGLIGQAGGTSADFHLPNVSWYALTPFLVLVAGSLVVLVLGALLRTEPVRRAFAPLTALIAIAAGITAIPLWHKVSDHGAYTTIAGSVGIDGFSLFLTFVICAGTALAALFADGYLRREGLEGPEVYVLMLLSASGGLVMAFANDLIVVFLGLEILSIAVYVLAGSHLRRTRSGEAALKYFILGAFSSAFFLYGISLVYGATGTTNLLRIVDFLGGSNGQLLTNDGLLVAGIALLLVGFGFKVTAAPLHMWGPDVYQGSPTPVVVFMASAVKAAGFAAMLRVLYLAFGTYRLDWQPIVYVLAVASILIGGVLAIVQTDVKRMMAYSSIAHAGYVLVGVEAATREGLWAALFYLAAYTFMVGGTFGVFTVLGRRGDGHHQLSEYVGLARRQPTLALVLTIFLLAQAGVPFTVGFVGKFYVILAAVRAHSYWLALIAMVGSVISAYLYLRIVVNMYTGDEDQPVTSAARIKIPVFAGIGLGLAVLFVVVFGIIPGPITDLAHHATLPLAIR
jgi:NADH-quinone oxidoreductase subunit N